MTTQEFEKELQIIHKDFSIKKSKVPGLARVAFQGAELFTIPDENIYDNENPQYAHEMPSGQMQPHRTRIEALGMAREIATRMMKDKDYSDAMKGTGEYSNQSLQIGSFKETVKVDLKPLEDTQQ